MTDYQVLARKYRPKAFQEVIGQESCVKTLKNALKFQRLAHAYLFCGSRGTGKTTLARIFAKALNCENLTADFEPCSQCTSCLEIASGSSLDVMEIDGASHRGIDDIRIISESVGYAPSRGKFKVYIIDEVHMLTREAFNALLKTLEEPPERVKFFFATTEPHKVPETILSRCQRFNLKRISLPFIVGKLRHIADDLKVQADDEALIRIAQYAEGGLRDAESLFDQIIAFSDGKVCASMVHEVLGIMPRKWFLELDHAFYTADLAKAFQIAQEVFLQGKDLTHFLEDLAAHFRSLLLCKLACEQFLPEADPSYKEALATSCKFYTQEQCLTILQLVIDAQNGMRGALSKQLSLEALLLRILRERHRLPIEYVVRRLSELEKEVGQPKEISSQPVDVRLEVPSELPKIEAPQPKQPVIEPKAIPTRPVDVHPETPSELPKIKAPKSKQPIIEPKEVFPQPVDARLEILSTLPKIEASKPTVMAPASESLTPPPMRSSDPMQKKSHHDTLIQFAAVELDGTIQRNRS